MSARPGQLVGVLGGGQLGRMLALAGLPLGLRFRFWDPSPDAPAADVGELVRADFGNPMALAQFTEGLAVSTYEFENVPAACAQAVERCVQVFPSVAALQTGQDRFTEKKLFKDLGIGVPDFESASTPARFNAVVSSLGFPLVAKTLRMGYDGKGQAVLRTPADAEGAWAALGGVPLLIERFIAFERELSVIACRGRNGSFVAYPLVENVHEGGILRLSRTPNPPVSEGLQEIAAGYARAIMELLGYVGVLAVEFFEVGGRLLANEMAPRVHNSGHWTIEGAACGQFENHCRAVAGLPLGEPGVREPWAMVNLIGTIPDPAAVLAIPGAHLHLYGKPARPGRKVGHVTFVGADAEARAKRLCH